MGTPSDDDLWRALANPLRRRLLDLLAPGPRATGELAAEFDAVSRCAVVQHLNVLRKAGVVLVRRSGRRRMNYLNAVPIRRLYERWVGRLGGLSAAGMLSLERHVSGVAGHPQEGMIEMNEKKARVVEIEQEIRLAAPIEKVFRSLTEELDGWWKFRTRPDAKIVFEPRVGGTLHEDWGGGRGIVYGHVTCYDPPHRVCTAGVSGWAAATMISWHRLEVDGESTVVKKSMVLFGDVSDELAGEIEGGSRAVLEDQLRAYVEAGSTS